MAIIVKICSFWVKHRALHPEDPGTTNETALAT